MNQATAGIIIMNQALLIIILLAVVLFSPEVGGEEWVPKAAGGDDDVKYLNEEELRKEGRSLAAFETCADCTCCKSRGQACSKRSCCHSLICGQPDKPYGVCTFSPISCTCTGCGSASASAKLLQPHP